MKKSRIVLYSGILAIVVSFLIDGWSQRGYDFSIPANRWGIQGWIILFLESILLIGGIVAIVISRRIAKKERKEADTSAKTKSKTNSETKSAVDEEGLAEALEEFKAMKKAEAEAKAKVDAPPKTPHIEDAEENTAMTLEETVALAETGDYDAIWYLGRYYLDKKDFKESLRWYTFGAEKGYTNCMNLAVSVGTLYGRVLRKALGSAAIDESISVLKEALGWIEKLKALGSPVSEDKLDSANAELGSSYVTLGISLREHDEKLAEKCFSDAIDLLISVYSKMDSYEYAIDLAFALNYHGEIVGHTEEASKLEFSLLSLCVDYFFYELDHSDIAAYFLGTMYMDGRGCEQDYNKAVYYFKKANDAGFECSQMLDHFEQTPSGDYRLKGQG